MADYTEGITPYPPDYIFTQAVFEGAPGEHAEIEAAMQQVAGYREANQPVKSRTGGSAFKNPPRHSAWKLTGAAGCRGLRVSPRPEVYLDSINHGWALTRIKLASIFERTVHGADVWAARRTHQTSGRSLRSRFKDGTTIMFDEIGIAGTSKSTLTFGGGHRISVDLYRTLRGQLSGKSAPHMTH